MSSSKTANLQLNQWQAGDAFLRTEFNEDNSKIDAGVRALDAKIDAAVGALEPYATVHKLIDKTLTATTHKLDLSLSGINLQKYAKLELLIVGTSVAESTQPAQGTLNNLENTKYCSFEFATKTDGPKSVIRMGTLPSKGCPGYLYSEFYLLSAAGLGFYTKSVSTAVTSPDQYWSCCGEQTAGAYCGPELTPANFASIQVKLLGSGLAAGARIQLRGVLK